MVRHRDGSWFAGFERPALATFLACLCLLEVSGQGRPRVPLVAGAVTENGAKVVGARVHVVWLSHEELPGSLVWAVDRQPIRRLQAKTKENGRFRIAMPEVGDYAVYAQRGTARSALIFPVRPGAYLDLELKPERVLVGRVQDRAGRPAVGAKVGRVVFGNVARTLEHYRYPLFTEPVLTDANGGYRLPVFPDHPDSRIGMSGIRAWTEEMESTERFYVVAGQTKGSFQMLLARGRNMTGSVFGNGPLAGAQVFDPLTGAATRTAADGGFRFAGHSGSLIVAAESYLRQRIKPDDSGRVNVRMQKGVTLRIELRRGGQPWAKRRVLFASPVGGVGHVPWVVQTDERGRCQVDGLKANMPLSGYAEVEGRFCQFLSTFAKRDASVQVYELRDREIRGRVMGLLRQPLAGVRVFLQPVVEEKGASVLPKTYRPTPLVRLVHTDRAGRFAFRGVMPGRHQIAVNGGVDGFVQVPVAAGMDTGGKEAKPLQIALSAGASLGGTVQKPDGEPAVGAKVQFILNVGAWVGGSTVYLRTRTDEKGRFEFRGLPKEGSYTSYAMLGEKGAGYWSMMTGQLGKGALTHRLAPHSGRYQ